MQLKIPCFDIWHPTTAPRIRASLYILDIFLIRISLKLLTYVHREHGSDGARRSALINATTSSQLCVDALSARALHIATKYGVACITPRLYLE